MNSYFKDICGGAKPPAVAFSKHCFARAMSIVGLIHLVDPLLLRKPITSEPFDNFEWKLNVWYFASFSFKAKKYSAFSKRPDSRKGFLKRIVQMEKQECVVRTLSESSWASSFYVAS